MSEDLSGTCGTRRVDVVAQADLKNAREPPGNSADVGILCSSMLQRHRAAHQEQNKSRNRGHPPEGNARRPRAPRPTLMNSFADLLLEIHRHHFSAYGILQRRSHPYPGFQLLRAPGALLQMPKHLVVRFHEEFVADVRIQILPNFLARAFAGGYGSHAPRPSSAVLEIPYERAMLPSNSRKSFLPRLKRDMTVPIGISSMCAISL